MNPRRLEFCRFTLLPFMMLSLTCNHAYAYLDPGTGSLLLQGLIAAVAGAIMFLRSPLQTIKHLMQRLATRLGKKSDSK